MRDWGELSQLMAGPGPSRKAWEAAPPGRPAGVSRGAAAAQDVDVKHLRRTKPSSCHRGNAPGEIA